MKEYTARAMAKTLLELGEDVADLCSAIPVHKLSKAEASRIQAATRRFREHHASLCETLRAADVQRATKEH